MVLDNNRMTTAMLRVVRWVPVGSVRHTVRASEGHLQDRLQSGSGVLTARHTLDAMDLPSTNSRKFSTRRRQKE